MTNIKVVLACVTNGAGSGWPALGQDLDGTLKKIKTSGTFTIGYREAAPPFSFRGRTSGRWVTPSISACMSRPPFKNSSGWRISSSIGCR